MVLRNERFVHFSMMVEVVGGGGGGGRVKQCFYLISMAQRDQWVH